jgi:hypothetical protein
VLGSACKLLKRRLTGLGLGACCTCSGRPGTKSRAIVTRHVLVRLSALNPASSCGWELGLDLYIRTQQCQAGIFKLLA